MIERSSFRVTESCSRRLLMRILFIITLFVSLLITTAAIAGPSGYHVAKTYKIGGDGGWDYLTVDSKARRVYITRGTHVMVVDADTGAVVGDIPNTNGVHGIAVASEFDKGFISDGRDGTITIFDLKTLKVLGTAAAGKNPDAIIYDPVSKRVFSFNGTSKDATAVDAKSGNVAGTIALGGKPEAGVSDGKGHIFVNIEDTSEIVQFDANKLSVENRWKIAPGDGSENSPAVLSLRKQNDGGGQRRQRTSRRQRSDRPRRGRRGIRS